MIKLWKKERWLLVPCPDYDVAAMEAWLEQQAQKGLFLSAENGFFLGFACFEVGNPKRVRYRLDAIPKEKVFADFPENKAAAIQLAQEMGWEFVTERREFLIYRCGDEALPELNTDPAVQALSLKRIQSTLSNRVFMSFYFLFIYPVLLLSFRLWTFLRNRDGILAFWTSGGKNNAATEGFNRKTRGLLEMSYGFHDYKFLRLRIFDLGEKKSIKG